MSLSKECKPREERTCTIPLSEYDELQHMKRKILENSVYALYQNSEYRYWNTSQSFMFLTKDDATEELLETIERQQKENNDLRKALSKQTLRDNSVREVNAEAELEIKAKKWWQI